MTPARGSVAFRDGPAGRVMRGGLSPPHHPPGQARDGPRAARADAFAPGRYPAPAVTLAARQDALIAELAAAGGPHERLQALLERGCALDEVPTRERVDALLVPGCQARVWLDARARDGRLWIAASTDAPLVAGLVGLVCEPCHGATLAEVLAGDLDPLPRLGLDRRLTPTRQRGLAAVRARLLAAAAAPTAGTACA